MRRLTKGIGIAAAAALCAVSLSGCEQAREAIGMNKQSPDEFAVVTRAPLTLPPDYGLRPPKPGAPRPQEGTVKDSARSVLIPGSGKVASKAADEGLTKGETVLLAKAGATNADPSIRGKIDRESSILATENDSFTDRLIFWQKREPAGTVVDPTKESQRLQENAGLGKSSTTGATPRIERKPKGWLEGLIN